MDFSTNVCVIKAPNNGERSPPNVVNWGNCNYFIIQLKDQFL